MLKKSLLSSFIVTSLLFSLITISSAKVYKVDDYIHSVEPEKEHAKLSFIIAKQLQYQHYRQMVLDDKLSSKVFDRFLKSLDPSRTFFLASDIKVFEEFRYQLDNNFHRGELKDAFKTFNLYQKRHAERLVYSLNLLENNYEQFDLSGNQEVLIDREEAPWPKTLKEQKEVKCE